MSFSSEVKAELSEQLGRKRHCQLAEMAAIIAASGEILVGEYGYSLVLRTENLSLARKYYALIRKAFHARTEVRIRRSEHGVQRSLYLITVGGKPAEDILTELHMISEEQLEAYADGVCAEELYSKNCCKRAFLRGAFLASGSISNPEKAYHYELVCATKKRAEQLRDIMREFDMEARIVCRKGHFVTYVKEGSQLVDLLNVMEAHGALMELENVRIIREISGTVNRKVNCETANINKTVSAAVQQIEDISFLRDHLGFGKLPDNLVEIAQARLAMPEASLIELGEALNPPVGKSGVNHRLRKIREIAESLRIHGEDFV